MAEDLRAARDGWADDVEATMLAARALVAISAQSLAEVEDVVTPSQLRVLVMIAAGAAEPRRGRAGAGRASVERHARLRPVVAAGLLDRHDDPADRRNLQLQLTEQGRAWSTR